MTKELTGRHVLIIAVSAFAIVIAANMAMLFAATGSFPGLVVKSAYVEGQGWNDRVEAQQALGLTSEIAYEPGLVTVGFRNADGQAVELADLTIRIGRPASDIEDQVLTADAGAFAVDLAPGQWQIEVKASGYRSTAALYVPEAK